VGDGRQLLKLAVRLALQSFTGIDFFMNLVVNDLFEIAQEIKEASKENG
jgi:hypothetical protein